MLNESLSRTTDSRRWVVFGVFSSVYFLVYFHRMSPSVIAQDLLNAFQTNATALGFMSSMYFYLYALEQPLVGRFSDLIGPRRVVGFWSLAAACGCFLFGLAPTIGWASVGRALIGLGVGGVYVPALKALSQWFDTRRFATMTGMLLAIGNLGAIFATTPLAWMAGLWGWRATFLFVGGLTLLLALATFFIVQDHGPNVRAGEKGSDEKDSKTGDSRGSARQVITSLRFWVLAGFFFGSFGTFVTFMGLWATPFLMSLFKMDSLHASHLNMLVPVGFIIGAPLSGWLMGRFFHNRINFMACLLAIQTGVWACLTWPPSAFGAVGLVPVFLLMGAATGGFGTTLWTLVRETTPAPVFGTISGLLNPFPFLGVALLQVWTGAILDRTAGQTGNYPPAAFSDAFLVCLIIVTTCLILSLLFRKRIQLPL
ncbi:MAG: MFS transporter [Pseudomonadota bacterium]